MNFKKARFLILFVLFFIVSFSALAQKDYKLWLQYEKVSNPEILAGYNASINGIVSLENTPTSKVASNELELALNSMLGKKLEVKSKIENENIIIGSKASLNSEIQKQLESDFAKINDDGFIIKSISIKNKKQIVITGKKDIGVLYGVYSFLRILQSHKSIENLNITDAPKTNIRILNHWDNLDRTVERGYAGFSLWNWQKLPEFIDQRYIDYARANASIGINGTVLTNVNANALILTPQYLEKVEALANVFRPYGIKVYLTARFSAPIEIGGLKTADPKDPIVMNWWKEKAKEIYKRIPDFGGFLVKANSEGQPGPQNYGRDHVYGANMLAYAVAPFGGIVMWRAFVYSEHDANDRAKQAYAEFVPYDGKFRENVIVQVKNGAIDFQPREPFHPMFGAMPKTPLMMEFQITQEYLGFSTHLVYLPKLFQEVLESDTYQKGKGSLVAKVVDGTLDHHKLTGMPIVALLSDDMKEFAEEPKEIQILDENGELLLAGDNDRRFFEASWLHKYNGKYYFSYSTGDTHFICYGIGDSPYGPFTYKGKILNPVIGWTSHHSICEVQKEWYLFYHDSSLSKGVTHLRSIKVTKIRYNEDGSIVTIDPYGKED